MAQGVWAVLFLYHAALWCGTTTSMALLRSCSPRSLATMSITSVKAHKLHLAVSKCQVHYAKGLVYPGLSLKPSTSSLPDTDALLPQGPLYINPLMSFIDEKCLIFMTEEENRLEYTIVGRALCCGCSPPVAEAACHWRAAQVHAWPTREPARLLLVWL
jgi:hypothetical protein